jgi:hypothetical protein
MAPKVTSQTSKKELLRRLKSRTPQKKYEET